MTPASYKKLASHAFALLVVTFIALYATTVDFTNFRNVNMDPILLSVSVIVALSFRYWGVIVWKYILLKLGASTLPSFSSIANIYARAWMGRYIPGKITWILAKVYFAEEAGITKRKMTVSALVEGGIQAIVLLTLSILMIGMDSRLNVISIDTKIIILLIGSFGLIILQPAIFNYLTEMLYRLVTGKQGDNELRIDYTVLCGSSLLYVVGALISGVSFYLLVRGVYPNHVEAGLLYMIGAYNLSGALGMVTPILPSGIGIRDGALLVLLTIIIPPDIALIVTGLARLWSLFVDILFFMIASSINRFKYKIF